MFFQVHPSRSSIPTFVWCQFFGRSRNLPMQSSVRSRHAPTPQHYGHYSLHKASRKKDPPLQRNQSCMMFARNPIFLSFLVIMLGSCYFWIWSGIRYAYAGSVAAIEQASKNCVSPMKIILKKYYSFFSYSRISSHLSATCLQLGTLCLHIQCNNRRHRKGLLHR